MIAGEQGTYISYGDDNQSYVITTAKRLGTDPVILAHNQNDNIKNTIHAYNIDMDSYSIPDQKYNKYVLKKVETLMERGLIIEKEIIQFFDADTGNPLYESFVTGHCHKCLLETKGGICESCGHPNDLSQLINIKPTGYKNANITHKKVKHLVLPIENYRDELINYYKNKRGIWRPHIIDLVDELLSEPLDDYQISHISQWGIPIDINGWSHCVINVWAEMGLGLLYSLRQQTNSNKFENSNYAQFLGYDNSYFFAIVHPVLQFALEKAGDNETKLPDFIFTNEFYNLDNKKFSTSKGHVLWGKELLQHISADEARLYLSLNAPELSEANFELENAIEFAKTLRINLTIIKTKLQLIDKLKINNIESVVAKNIENRIKHFCEPENFSPKEIAKIVHSLILFLSQEEVLPDERKNQYDLFIVFKKYVTIFLTELNSKNYE